MQLGTSPFGHYETWIAESDFHSFLEAYKGYPLPDAATIEKMKQEFQKDPKTTTPNSKQTAISKESAEIPVKNDATTKPAGLSYSLISPQKAPEAKGKQLEVASRSSATDVSFESWLMWSPALTSADQVAKVAGWGNFEKDLADRIPTRKVNDVTFKGPGLVPAEVC